MLSFRTLLVEVDDEIRLSCLLLLLCSSSSPTFSLEGLCCWEEELELRRISFRTRLKFGSLSAVMTGRFSSCSILFLISFHGPTDSLGFFGVGVAVCRVMEIGVWGSMIGAMQISWTRAMVVGLSRPGVLEAVLVIL